MCPEDLWTSVGEGGIESLIILVVGILSEHILSKYQQ